MNQPLLSDEMLDTLQREMSVNNPTSVAAARGPSDAGGETISVIPQPTQNLHWMRVTDDTVFFLGPAAVVIFVAGLKTGHSFRRTS